MAVFNKFHQFVEDVAKGVHGDLSAADLRVVLSNVAPVAANAVLADITEIAAGNGYAAGGAAAAVASCEQTAGVLKLVIGDAAWTAAGGSIGPFRYAVLYNNTPASNPLIGWYDRGAALTLDAGDDFATDFDPGTGVLTLG